MATEYGKRLTAARTHAGLKQQELANLTGVAQATISGTERAGYGSRNTVLYARACGVSSDWLATGDGDMLAAADDVAAPLSPVEAVDLLRGLRAVLDDVPAPYKRRAVHDALLAVAAWISPETAQESRAPHLPDAEKSTSAKSLGGATDGKTPAR